MSATAFLLGQTPDRKWSLVCDGTPIACRKEFKRLFSDRKHGLIEVRYFDTYGAHKRKGFRKNRIGTVDTVEEAEPEEEEADEGNEPEIPASEEFTGEEELEEAEPEPIKPAKQEGKKNVTARNQKKR